MRHKNQSNRQVMIGSDHLYNPMRLISLSAEIEDNHKVKLVISSILTERSIRKNALKLFEILIESISMMILDMKYLQPK